MRAAVENLIKESNNDAGLTAHPSSHPSGIWLTLFQREETATVAELTHWTRATTRLRMLYLAARIWRHAGQTGIRYESHHQEQGLFDALMARLRAIEKKANRYGPVVAIPLRA